MYTVQTVSVIISVVLKPKTNAAVKYTQSRTTEKDKNRDTDRKPKGLLLTSYPIIVPDKSSFHWNLMADVSVRDPRGGTTFIYGGLHYSRAPQPITQIRKKKKKSVWSVRLIAPSITDIGLSKLPPFDSHVNQCQVTATWTSLIGKINSLDSPAPNVMAHRFCAW